MKKLYFTISILLFGLSNAQLYTPNGNVNGVTTNSQTGNVGIGTDSPQAKLEVAGDFKSTQGIFTTSLPNGMEYSYSQNLSINDAAVALSAGSIIGSGPGYVKTRMLNFFDFPGKTVGSNTGAIAFFNIADRNDMDRFRFIGVAGLDGTAVMYNKFQQEVYKVYDNGSDKIVMTLPKPNSYFGIGTSNPQRKLHVIGDTGLSGNVFLTTPSASFNTYGAQLYFGDSSENYDPIFISRFNNNTDQSELRVSIGDDYNDKFVVGRQHYLENDFTPMFVVSSNGNIGIGAFSPQTKLDVAGTSSFSGNMKVDAKLEAKEVKVTTSPTADFVFEKDYNLPKLEEVEKHIKEKKHLPEIASAKEMEKEGVNIGEFQIKLLQKIEELTLYSIQLNKENKDLKNSSYEQEKLIKLLIERVKKLESNKK